MQIGVRNENMQAYLNFAQEYIMWYRACAITIQQRSSEPMTSQNGTSTMTSHDPER